MSRELEDWIESYVHYNRDTESATVYHRWTALSVIAAALRKKIHLSLGRINIYPNLYVVFVGEPGGPRKSQAITFGTKMLNKLTDVVVCADAITPQAMIQDLEGAVRDDQLPNGDMFKHASLTVTSKEFETFLGQKSDNQKMIIALTDLFDAQEIPWKYRTKHSGSNVIPSVFLNILAATTPESLNSSFPSSAIGTGLTSRIMFIWADGKTKKVTFPHETPEDIVLRKKLDHDLFVISKLSGTYMYSEDAARKWHNWYQSYVERDPSRLCNDPSFNGWYERKPLYIQKISIIVAAARSEELIINWDHVETALRYIEEVEAPMINVFRAVGRSAIAADVELVSSIIRVNNVISEEQLQALVWRDIDNYKLDNVVTTAMKAGRITRRFEHPTTKQKGIWYITTGG
jgi:hypothetical protein